MLMIVKRLLNCYIEMYYFIKKGVLVYEVVS